MKKLFKTLLAVASLFILFAQTPQVSAKSWQVGRWSTTTKVAEPTKEEIQLLQILEFAFDDSADVEFDVEEKVYSLNFYDKGFKQGLRDQLQGVPGASEEWQELVDELAGVSESIENILGEGYFLNIMNPFNEDRIIAAFRDGEAIFDIFNSSVKED